MAVDFEFQMPRDKHDIETATALVALGWERVEPAMPQILDWVLDSNWPVARVLQPFLVNSGAKLAPFFRTILDTDDDTAKYHILSSIVMCSNDLAMALRPELERLCRCPTHGELREEVSDLAREILKNLCEPM